MATLLQSLQNQSSVKIVLTNLASRHFGVLVGGVVDLVGRRSHLNVVPPPPENFRIEGDSRNFLALPARPA